MSVILRATLFLALIAGALADVGDAVTCGSVVKLIHKDTKHHLHSHPIAWGSGSGQQSVTTTGSQNDANSLWLIKESTKYLNKDGKNEGGCELGVPVKCGDKIRLEHIGTGKNLHRYG
jgi:dolichyl-phosphate-mannose--protein O-mannosyl transferase